MEKNDLKLDWQQKYWLLQAIADWNPILDPPDPDGHDAMTMLDHERTFFDPKPKPRMLKWSFMVEGFAIYRPGEHELFVSLMTHGKTPEDVVNEWWEMAIQDNRQGSLLVSFDTTEEDPTVDSDDLSYFEFRDQKFVEVDAPNQPTHAFDIETDRRSFSINVPEVYGEIIFSGGSSSSIGTGSSLSGDLQGNEIRFDKIPAGTPAPIGIALEDGKKGDLLPVLLDVLRSQAKAQMIDKIPAGKSGQIRGVLADGSIGWINSIPAKPNVDLTPVSREFWEALKRFEEHLHEAKFTPYNEPITDEALRKMSRGVFEVGHSFEVASGLALKGLFMFYSDNRNEDWTYINLDDRHFSYNARMVLKFLIEKFPHLMMRPKDVETLPGLPNLKEWQSIRFDRIASGDLKEGDLVAIGPDRTVFKSKGSSS